MEKILTSTITRNKKRKEEKSLASFRYSAHSFYYWLNA